jgi:hypothetical protein
VVDLSKMRVPDWILGGCALVLIIDLLFFPWHSVDTVLGDFNYSATESPNGFWGILALLLALVVLVVVILRRLTTVNLPELPIPWGDALFYGAIATLAVLVIKLLLETDALGFGAWLGILLAGGMVYGGFATKQADTSTRTGSTPPTPF